MMVVALLTSACGARDTPAAPSPIEVPPPAVSLPVTLAGAWHGYLKGAECVAALPCNPERTLPFTLRVLAAADGYRATFELPAESAGQMKVIMDVVGRPDADRLVVFSGSRGPIDSDGYHVELRRLAVRIEPASGLTGEIDLQKWPTANLSARSLRGEITSASYRPLSPAGSPSMNGTWRGRAVIRGCEGHCPIYQDAGDEMTVVLALGQVGQTVSGHMQTGVVGCSSCWLPVSGSVAAGTPSLSSQPFAPPGAAGRQLQLEGFEAALDEFARLAGRFVIAATDRIAIAPFDVLARLDCEFTWLQRD